MNNLIFEMKKIADDAKKEGLSKNQIFVRLKEFLHYFVLDFIYNSEFKGMVFYGGSCLRIIYDLPRMSEDLDFEAMEDAKLEKLADSLEKYFKKDLGLEENFSTAIKTNAKGDINRIILNFPIMKEIGLSLHLDETLKIKVEARLVSADYFNNLEPVFTPKNKYGKSFVIKHYDLPSLFASKLLAIINRPQKGYFVGTAEEGVGFKGRDFFDLIWYMEKGIFPNEEMFKANGVDKSVKEIFDEISVFISKKDVSLGLRKDLELLISNRNYAESFAREFEGMFRRLREEKYKI